MSDRLKDYYRKPSDEGPIGNFHDVILLHETPKISWEEIISKVPTLPKGWYELSRLPVEDRISFTCDYWLATIPYHPDILSFLTKFFGTIEEISVYITQKKFDDPFIPQLVYTLKDDVGFFRGHAPAKDNDLIELQKQFPEIIFPLDYLAFLRIHDGFAKAVDTGIIPSSNMLPAYHAFQVMLKASFAEITDKGSSFNPSKLIPFYESFGLPCYQCFWAEWYPDQEMGNVYYSDISKSLSKCEGENISSIESLAFSTFTDWLMFYLETIEEINEI